MTAYTLRASAVALAVTAALASTAHAAPASTSAYRTDPQTSQVEDATSDSIGQVNMIACIMHALSADALVNDGPYLALVDKNKCDAEKRSSASNAGSTSDGAQAAAQYVTATVDSTRASNNDPMIAKVWLDLDEEGMHQTIYVHVSATQAPSADNAYGVFRLDYCGKAEGMTGCPSRGYLEGTTDGLNFYQLDSNGNGGTETTAMRLATASSAGGSGRLVRSGGDGTGAFVFAYDSSFFRRSDDTTDQCFTRDASDPDTGMSVWRYGLYDASSGARINRNSGFPIDVTSNGAVYHGYLGYYGLSLPSEAQSALQNGSTVEKVDYSSGNNPTRTSYTVVKSDGKLTKYTRHTRTLHSMDQIRFTTFLGNDASSLITGAQPNAQYELYWDDARGTFVATAVMACDQNGCQNQALPSAQDVSASYWATRGGVQGYSQSLGGEVFINLQGVSGTVDSNSVQVVYRSQDLVYPADLPPQLFCVQNCPSAATLAAYFSGSGGPGASPYVAGTFNNFQPTQANAVVSYTTDAATVTLRDGANGAVTFSDRDALMSHPEYLNGVRTGRLFTRLADAECSPGSGTYCDYKVNDAEVYYQWETGSNSWNQFAAVKDSGGTFVTFDAPLQLAYTVPTGPQYGQYAGKGIVLQYGGFGDLSGIPGNCVSRITNAPISCNSQDARYVPSFAIPFDETKGAATSTDGQTAYLVKWLDREIRFAQKPLSACTAAGLTLPSNVVLPTEAGLKDPSDSSSDVYIGTKPTVTAAPRVIHGDVKY